MKKAFLSHIILLSLVLIECTFSTPIPPPGWRDPVYRSLLQGSSLPPGWNAGYEIPEYIKDPTTNHVSMEWRSTNGGLVLQLIWRAYTIEDAQSKFDELKRPKRELDPTLAQGIKYVPSAPPSEIKFKSTRADEFYITCGWLHYPYCVTIARYRNYVVSLNTTFSGTIGSYTHVEGLTYTQLEALIRDMDEIMGTIQK